jgi:hypothetical protein
MKKILVILTLFFIGTGVTVAQNAAGDSSTNVSNTDTAKIKFEKKTHDFGTIEEGTQAKTTFKYSNTGNVPVILTNVRPSCGCTTPNWSREPLQPGESAVITAVFNSRGKSGTFHKSITVTSNAGTTMIYIKGNVIKQSEEPQTPVRIKN